MKYIIFGFSRPKKWKPFAEMIMGYDNTNFDHGYTKFRSDRWDAEFIYQSSGSRTNFMGGMYFAANNIVVEEYIMSIEDETEARIGHMCVEREGRPYPTMTMVGLFIVKLFSVVGLKIKNPFPSVDSDCIAEQGFILAEGLGIQSPFDFNETTPKEFRDWLNNLPGIARIV